MNRARKPLFRMSERGTGPCNSSSVRGSLRWTPAIEWLGIMETTLRMPGTGVMKEREAM